MCESNGRTNEQTDKCRGEWLTRWASTAKTTRWAFVIHQWVLLSEGEKFVPLDPLSEWIFKVLRSSKLSRGHKDTPWSEKATVLADSMKGDFLNTLYFWQVGPPFSLAFPNSVLLGYRFS
jgi:hypothetical protein